MAFDLTHDIIIPLVVGTGASGLIVFLAKNWLTKTIDHSFNKKIEDYKSILGKQNIGYQIEKTEFAKKKYEQVMQLYDLVLERGRRNTNGYDLLSNAGYVAIRDFYDKDYAFNKDMREKVAIASIFLDKTLIDLIESYQVKSSFIIVTLVSLAEHRASENLLQMPFVYLKVVQNEDFNSEKATDQLNKHSRSSKELFEKITLEFKNYLSID